MVKVGVVSVSNKGGGREILRELARGEYMLANEVVIRVGGRTGTLSKLGPQHVDDVEGLQMRL